MNSHCAKNPLQKFFLIKGNADMKMRDHLLGTYIKRR